MNSSEPERLRIRWSEPKPRGPVERIGAALLGWVDRAVQGEDWRLRAPLLPVLAWWFWRHLSDPRYASIWDGLNLVLHEAGHLIFFWSGSEFWTAAGGTIFELLCPLLVAFVFGREHDAFGITVCIFWLGTASLHVAPYAADARAQLLPLVSVGGGPVGHDWFEMLWRLDLLEHDAAIGGAFRLAGLGLMAVGIGAGGWVLRRMARHDREEKGNGPPDGSEGP